MSAIEVLKSEKVLYIEKIKEIESRFNGMPSDIKESYQKSVKVYQEFIDALDEALLALEQKEKLKKWLESNISQLLELEDKLKDIDENYYANTKIRRIVLEEVLKELERVGEQK
jgi:hypothetical protein